MQCGQCAWSNSASEPTDIALASATVRRLYASDSDHSSIAFDGILAVRHRMTSPVSSPARNPDLIGFRSRRIVAGGGEVVGAFGRGEGVDEAADGGPEAIDGPLGGLAQERLEFGEGILDRVEVGTVGRQVEQRRAGGLDQRSHAWPLVARQVVHDHHVAWPQLRDENLLDVDLEGVAVDRPIEHEGRD